MTESKATSKPRVAALVGPYMAGKTSLLESLLSICGVIGRKGLVKNKDTVGDASEEARERGMSIETTVIEAEFLGDPWTFLDCPGSVEFLQEARHALMVADVAVVVCDPDPERAVMVQPLLKFLDQHKIPHMIFLNKVDHANVSVSAALEALQGVSERPLILREVPIKSGDTITGYVDLVSERAYAYEPGQASRLVSIPDAVKEREETARQELLEQVADYDDHLLEELLEDIDPPKTEIYDDFAKELAEDLIVPVFFGAAEKDEGVRRLLKALRHETPEPDVTAARLGLSAKGPCAQVFKTVHSTHTGQLSYSRIWSGEVSDGMTCSGHGKVSGLYALDGQDVKKISKAGEGRVAALGRLEKASLGDLLGAAGSTVAEPWPAPAAPLFAMAITPEKDGDDVKLTGALALLCEEDPSLSVAHDQDTGQLLLWGQGDIHLQVALAKLKHRHHVQATGARPLAPFKETIRKSQSQQGRHKKQSGGHGQFGDVHITLKPLGRGEGFAFEQSVVGGAVPRHFIPSVEKGVVEALGRGPLGFPVVDLAVELTDGSHHAVDSSDQAFSAAARLAMREGLPKCDPVLLEPILHVEVEAPSAYTSKVQRALSTRRGQILGFDRKEGWDGWDAVQAYVPQSEMHDLIIELRSNTMGVGRFSWRFDRMQELTGRHAQAVIEARKG